MNWKLTPYVLLYLGAVSIMMPVAILAWQRRRVRGGMSLALMLVAITWWCLSAALEAAAVDLSVKIAVSKVQYLGIHATATLLLIFAARYTEQDSWLTWRNQALLWVVPAITVLIAATNEWHSLVWADFRPGLPGTNLIVYVHGPWFFIALVYTYCLVLASSILLLRSIVRYPHLYRLQVIVLLLAMLMPWLGNAMYITQLAPIPGLETTMIGFVFAGLALAWAVLRFQLGELVPIARDQLVENMVDGMLVLDSVDRIVDINPAAKRILQLPSGNVLGQPATQVLAAWPDIVTCVSQAERAQIALRSEQAPVNYYDLQISPLRNGRRDLSGRLLILRDVTAQQQAAEELRMLNTRLQTRNQELDAFAHTVAHDLKNPLGRVNTAAQLLQQYAGELSPDEFDVLTTTIAGSSQRMQTIINSLLLLSSARQAEVRLAPLNMAGIVAQACERLDQEIRDTRAIIRQPETWPVAMGYEPWLVEVWYNYLSNALKYGGQLYADPPVAPLIEVGATLLEDGYVRYWVKDNGHGIAPEDQARLFVPFTRLQSLGDGHGLGLSIVQRIVTRLGGEVGIQSSPGQGSTFSFTLLERDEPLSRGLEAAE